MAPEISTRFHQAFQRIPENISAAFRKLGDTSRRSPEMFVSQITKNSIAENAEQVAVMSLANT